MASLRLIQSLFLASVILIGILTVVCLFYLESNKNSSGTVIHIVPRHRAVSGGRKIIFAFRYWEQLTMATNNLLRLAALAAHGGRQVVVPFAKGLAFTVHRPARNP